MHVGYRIHVLDIYVGRWLYTCWIYLLSNSNICVGLTLWAYVLGTCTIHVGYVC